MSQEYLQIFGDKKLLFGLQWQSIVGQVAPANTKLLAKQQRAKQWVISGQTFFTLGLSFRRGSRKKDMYSAAACHALLYPKGWHASIYKISNDLYWLAAVHEGTPLRLGDKLFTDKAQAQLVLSQLITEYSVSKYHIEPVAMADFLALISTHTLQKAALQQVRPVVWRPVFVLFGLACAWAWWQFETMPVEAAVALPEVDPYLAYWEKKQFSLNGNDAVLQLIRSWEQIPLMLKGWQLQEVVCDSDLQHWLCNYQYKASTDTTTTLDLESVLPQGWHSNGVNMQSASFQHQINFSINSGYWRSAEQVRLQLLSQLQSIRPAFSVLKLAEPKSVLPRLTTPSTYSPIFSQQLHFEGPLRSFVFLADFDEPLHWQRAVLQYRPQVDPSLKSSALHVKLQGVVYVRD